MKILVTGANGFIGKNLVSTLKNIKGSKDKTCSIDDLRKYTSACDFVFHLTGINRPKDIK